MSERALPTGFADLEPYAADWALPSAYDRDAARGSRSQEERQAFYDAFNPHLGAALDHLDGTPLEQHDAQQTNLMRMALSFAHVAQSIEVQGPDEVKHTRQRARIPFVRATADI